MGFPAQAFPGQVSPSRDSRVAAGKPSQRGRASTFLCPGSFLQWELLGDSSIQWNTIQLMLIVIQLRPIEVQMIQESMRPTEKAAMDSWIIMKVLQPFPVLTRSHPFPLPSGDWGSGRPWEPWCLRLQQKCSPAGPFPPPLGKRRALASNPPTSGPARWAPHGTTVPPWRYWDWMMSDDGPGSFVPHLHVPGQKVSEYFSFEPLGTGRLKLPPTMTHPFPIHFAISSWQATYTETLTNYLRFQQLVAPGAKYVTQT